jgi:hypothetical protein
MFGCWFMRRVNPASSVAAAVYGINESLTAESEEMRDKPCIC